MNDISANRLFEFYNETLDGCGVYLLNQDAETIGYNIFEVFDIGVISFLHKKSVVRLHEAGLISTLKMMKSLKLRELVFSIRDTEDWDLQKVNKSQRWFEIMKLSDEIKNLE
jgi:hypothetical protein